MYTYAGRVRVEGDGIQTLVRVGRQRFGVRTGGGMGVGEIWTLVRVGG